MIEVGDEAAYPVDYLLYQMFTKDTNYPLLTERKLQRVLAKKVGCWEYDGRKCCLM